MNSELIEALIQYVNARSDYAAHPGSDNLERCLTAQVRIEAAQQGVFLSEEQFDALAKWIRHEAWKAAGSAVNQPRAKDDTPEWFARGALTGNYDNPANGENPT